MKRSANVVMLRGRYGGEVTVRPEPNKKIQCYCGYATCGEFAADPDAVAVLCWEQFRKVFPGTGLRVGREKKVKVTLEF